MTELATQPITHPLTGQVLDLDNASPHDLAAMLVEVREHELLIRELKQLISSEVLARMDARAKWTMTVEDYKMVGTSPAPSEEFDALALREALLRLADDGLIAQEAVDAAVEVVISYKVKKAGVNALRKLEGEVADTVDAYAREVPRERYVRVERS